MAKRATTLFIRDNSINLLVIKGRQVEKSASAPLDPGLVSQGLVLDEAQAAEQIRQLFRQEKVAMTKVITALSGHDTLYRIITLPDVPDAVLPEAVKREAKRTIPTPLDEVYFSYQSIPSMKGERRVFLATYPRNSVDALIRTLRRAGIRPYVMDLAPLALCRIPDLPRSIIVNARLDHLEVMVIADRLPQVIRRLSLPGEAESLEERLPLFTEEFNRTVTFYNSSHMENPLDATVPVFVCGDLAEAPEMWRKLVDDREYPVEALTAAVDAPEGFDADQFMVNIGLALKELAQEKEGSEFSVINFNILPESYLPKHFSIARVLVPVGLVLGIGLIVFSVVMVLHMRAQIGALKPVLAAEEARVAQYNSEIAGLKSRIAAVGPTAEALNARISAMEMGRAEMAMDISHIHTLARGKVNLSRVNHSKHVVTVRGSASSCSHVYDFARDLRSGGRFSEVWISPIAADGRTFTFDLRLTK